MKKWRAKLLLLVVAVGTLAIALPSAASKDSIELPSGFPPLRDKVDTEKPATIVPTNPYLVRGPDYQPLGLNLQSELLSPELLRRADELGAGAYRLTIRETDFADEDSPNFFKLRNVVRRITESGHEIMLTLESARISPNLYSAYFIRIYNAVGSQVRYYQLADNINQHLGLSTADYSEALSLIRAFRNSQGDDFKIVLGGIRGIDRAFISELEEKRVFERVDALAFNLYPDANHMEIPYAGRELASMSLFTAMHAFGELASYGKPIYITDLGVSTAVSPLGVSQLDQASMLSRATLYLLNSGASRVFLHSLQDTDANLINPQKNMGLLTYGGKAKPAYYAIERLAGVLRGAFFFQPYFLFQMGNEFPAQGDPLFAHFLYRPTDRTTYFIYWTSKMNALDRYTNLVIYRPQLEVRGMMNLLSGESDAVPYRRAQNLILFHRLPLSHIPTFIEMTGEEPSG